jgi:hypothetical protein
VLGEALHACVGDVRGQPQFHGSMSGGMRALSVTKERGQQTLSAGGGGA